ncbi:hotdog fold thioesterase [Rothia sp. AR01]|uniref:Hotdog fold thioesterase n=1 Tax=Rothia santali TaxID=2949643 RepID=A0A9X2HDI3_9MICC|nr:hotdog fold thioesterase [Rothia santali]MCP3425194.1 hotdog fold thioesterase [Rothia santali]
MTLLTQAYIHRMVPLTRTLGIAFPLIADDRVHAKLDSRRDLRTAGGSLHNGAVMALADAAAQAMATVVREDGSIPVTTEVTARFFRPLFGVAKAVARPLHFDGSCVTVDVEIRDLELHLCARITQTVTRRYVPVL